MPVDFSGSDANMGIRSAEITQGGRRHVVELQAAHRQNDFSTIPAQTTITAPRAAELTQRTEGQSQPLGLSREEIKHVRFETPGKGDLRVVFDEKAPAELVQKVNDRLLTQAAQQGIIPRESLQELGRAGMVSGSEIQVNPHARENRVGQVVLPASANATAHEMRLSVGDDGKVRIFVGNELDAQKARIANPNSTQFPRGEDKAIGSIADALGVSADQKSAMLSGQGFKHIETNKTLPEVVAALEGKGLIEKGTTANLTNFAKSQNMQIPQAGVHQVVVPPGPQAANEPHTIRAPAHARAGGFVSPGVAAVMAGGAALAASGNVRAAVVEGAKAAAETLPGVDVLLAANPDEAKVRRNVHIATGAGTVAGAIAGGGVASVGTAAVAGVVTNVISEEVLRGWARHVEGKRDTVAPSAGEQFVTGAAQLVAKGYETAKVAVSTAAQEQRRETSFNAAVEQLNKPELGWKPHLDLDKNGKISLEEVKAVFAKSGITMQQLDKNKDHSITGAEITTALKEQGVGAPPSTPKVLTAQNSTAAGRG